MKSSDPKKDGPVPDYHFRSGTIEKYYTENKLSKNGKMENAVEFSIFLCTIFM